MLSLPSIIAPDYEGQVDAIAADCCGLSRRGQIGIQS